MTKNRRLLGEIDSNNMQLSSRKFNRRNYEPLGKENKDPNFPIFDDKLHCSTSKKRSPGRSALAPKNSIDMNKYTKCLNGKSNKRNEKKWVYVKDIEPKAVTTESNLDSTPVYGLKFV